MTIPQGRVKLPPKEERNMHIHTEHEHHKHDAKVETHTITGLMIAFMINMLLTVVELVAGVMARSTALIGDALHNTSDAFSILVAIIAYKIGVRPATDTFSFGFKRAETIGGFVNLILLFVSGVYLFCEGTARIISPERIDGPVIIWVSVLALIVDSLTARLSHEHAHANMNMKMVFVHNLADAFGSIGVIVSGLFVVILGWNFVDGVIAVMISVYMIFQSVVSFSPIVRLLMNACPPEMNAAEIRQALLRIKGVHDVHHIHLWRICEDRVSLECHVCADTVDVLPRLQSAVERRFHITHATFQVETQCHRKKCPL